MIQNSGKEGQSDRTAAVLYGSETGNAQNVAEELGSVLERLRYETSVLELNHASLNELLRNSLIVVVLSTTGQGDLPANAQTFWRKLRSTRLRPGCLKSVRFATFGLGDSSYPQFNWASRKVFIRLTQLGAEAICDRAEADEQHPDGIDGYYVQWVASLRQQLMKLHPLPYGLRPIPDDKLLQPKWILDFAGSNGHTIDEAEKSTATISTVKKGHEMSNEAPLEERSKEPKSHDDVNNHDIIPLENGITVTVANNERITPEDHWQDVRLVKLETNTIIPYSPGDAIAIQPKNSSEDVEHLIRLMGWGHVADRLIEFRFNHSSKDYHNGKTNGNIQRKSLPPSFSFIAFGAPLTLRKLITNYLDIMSIPRRSFFSIIAHFTTDRYQKERLLEFTDPNYLDELYDYTSRPRRSILEVLQEFTSVKISWQWAAHVLPFMRSRQFSIASGGVLKSSDLSPSSPSFSSSVPLRSPPDSSHVTGTTRFELLVAIVKYKTVIKRIRQGVCTRYIAALQPGQMLSVTLHTGGLRYSSADEETKPALMVAPGTGVAPMRALIYERLALVQGCSDDRPGYDNASNQSPRYTSETVLFFGCRNESADYFFRNEWDKIIRESNKQEKKDVVKAFKFQVFPAFSRDQKRKRYVQDLIREKASLVHDLICKRGGTIFVCGSSGKMPQAVREALIEAFQTEEGLDRSVAEAYMMSLEKMGRYKQETW